jgi:hypothetical protein
MAWAGIEARRWRWDSLAFFSILRPIEAYRKSSSSKKDVSNDKTASLGYGALARIGNPFLLHTLGRSDFKELLRAVG